MGVFYGRIEKLDTGFMAEYFPLYVEAAKLTFRLGMTGIVISLVIGVVCSLAGYYHVPVLRQIAVVYVERRCAAVWKQWRKDRWNQRWP